MKLTGIYALWWEEPSMVYVGQSQDIHKRYKGHLRKLKIGKHSNYKVQKIYNIYGNPSLEILETCSLEEINKKEIEWTAEFDSINTGLNIIEAGIVGHGPASNHSVYTKIQVLKCFRLLYTSDMSVFEIATKTGIADSTVKDLKNGGSHMWLKHKYPYLYNLMVLRNNNRKKDYQVGECTVFMSPVGEVISVDNINKFAKSVYSDPHQAKLFGSGLGKLRSGTREQYRGWTLASKW